MGMVIKSKAVPTGRFFYGQDCGGRISAPGTGSSHELRGEFYTSRFL